jgi:branched-chain amino acid aminotransferase
MAPVLKTGRGSLSSWVQIPRPHSRMLLDTDGNFSEGTGDNFFIIKNETIYSTRGRNILRGISRDYIFELCDELKLKYEEKDIEPYDVYTADEAFMTGTPFCMLPVTTLNSLPLGNGKKVQCLKNYLTVGVKT